MNDGNERRWVLAVVMVSAFLAPFMMSALNVALPVMARQLALDTATMGWVVTSYILAAAVALLPLGRLADIHGRRRVFQLGMVVYTIGTLACACAPGAAPLIAARVVSGAGAAMGFATGMAILTAMAPPAERGRALGWNIAAVYLGLSLGPFLGGVIARQLGWRWIFGLSAVGSLAASVVTALKLKREWAEARGARFDHVGALLYGAALVAFIYGLPLLPSTRGTVFVAASLGGTDLFAAWERRSASPVLDPRLFTRNPAFALASLAALINYSATAAVGYLLSLYLQYVKHLSPQQAGLVLMAQPVVMAVFTPLTGRLSDRKDPGWLASWGMVMAVAGLTAFCFLGERTPLAYVVAWLCVLGFGFALFSSPNTNAIMSAVERRHYGVASSAVACMRMIGQSVSMGIVMLTMALLTGRTIAPDDHAPLLLAMRVSLAICAGVCLAGVAASAARVKRPAAEPAVTP
jgi:EmrB/QacA subfamily drug resistance transporter